MTLFDKHMPTRSRQKIEADLDEVLGEDSRPASCSRVHGQLMFAGCDQHEHRSRTDLSCSKIRRVSDGKALTPKEVWEVLCENAKEHTPK